MNLHDPKYSSFALVREMLETPRIVGRFDFQAARDAADVDSRDRQVVFDRRRIQPHLSGEEPDLRSPANGNSAGRIHRGARQAHEYDLSQFAVFGASNSGKTKELISLIHAAWPSRATRKRFGLTANTPVHVGDGRLAVLHASLRQGRRGGRHQERGGAGLVLSLAAGPLGEGVAHGGQPAAGRPQAQEVLEAELPPETGRANRAGPDDLLRRPQQRRGRGVDAEDQRDHAQEERLPGRDLRRPRDRGDHEDPRRWSW